MNVTWEDKRLAGKQLFDAFDELGIDYSEFRFTNIKEPEHFLSLADKAMKEKVTIIGMGNFVQRILSNMNIKHKKLIHPAARGSIRRKSTYANHVKEVLKECD